MYSAWSRGVPAQPSSVQTGQKPGKPLPNLKMTYGVSQNRGTPKCVVVLLVSLQKPLQKGYPQKQDRPISRLQKIAQPWEPYPHATAKTDWFYGDFRVFFWALRKITNQNQGTGTKPTNMAEYQESPRGSMATSSAFLCAGMASL